MNKTCQERPFVLRTTIDALTSARQWYNNSILTDMENLMNLAQVTKTLAGQVAELTAAGTDNTQKAQALYALTLYGMAVGSGAEPADVSEAIRANTEPLQGRINQISQRVSIACDAMGIDSDILLGNANADDLTVKAEFERAVDEHVGSAIGSAVEQFAASLKFSVDFGDHRKVATVVRDGDGWKLAFDSELEAAITQGIEYGYLVESDTPEGETHLLPAEDSEVHVAAPVRRTKQRQEVKPLPVTQQPGENSEE